MAKTAAEETTATVQADAIDVTDSRTGKTYNLPITDGAIRANDLKKIRTEDEDDPVEHLFVTSTHDYLLFFTNQGRVYERRLRFRLRFQLE